MSGVGARGGGVSESLVASLYRGLRMCRAGVCNALIASVFFASRRQQWSGGHVLSHDALLLVRHTSHMWTRPQGMEGMQSMVM